MATCKNCIYSGICKVERQPAPLSDTFTYECECIEKYCIDFKDRSRLVELPFGVGDSYFEIFATIDDETAAIFEFHIDRIVQLKNAYGEPTEIFYEDRKAGRVQNALEPYSRRFRSREEAEKALKECEENA